MPTVPSIVDAVNGVDAFLVDAVTSPWMLPVLFAACLIDGFLPPVPSELLLITAATISWTSQPHLFVLVVATATAGAWAGDNIAYTVGRRIGLTPLPWMRRGRPQQVMESVQREFHHRPESILLTGRFVPVARVLINLTAGAARLPLRRFLPVSLVSAIAWACISAIIGVLVGTFVTPDPLVATTIAIGIALVAGVTVDRVMVWRRTIATQKARR